MKDSKPARESLTIKGALLSLFAHTVAASAIIAASPALAITIPAIAGWAIASGGNVVCIWGRIRADKKIS